MKNSRKIFAFMLSLVMLSSVFTGCTQPPQNQDNTSGLENNSKENISTEPEKKDDENPADSDIYKSYDADGALIRTGRDAEGKNGVVSTGRYEASKIGVEIIEKGGNAIDAAVATGFALGVCEPQYSGLGGGGFMTIRLADTKEVKFIDFREVAPSNATPEMWVVGSDGKIVGNEKMEGGKSIGVPGEVAGMIYALEKYGTMSLEEVIQPAIDLAEKGYDVTPVMSSGIKNSFDKFVKYGEAAKVYLKDDFPYETGDTIKNPDLANTLKTIAKDGRDGFYKGKIADAIIKAVQDSNGVMTLEDLANYQVEEVEPVKGTYRGYEIFSSPPPSSGGAVILQILNILENFDLASMEVNSAEYLHLFSEAFKMAYADRAQYMGDPKYVDVPLKGIMSKDYAKKLADKIDVTKSQSYEYDDPWMFEHEDTTHYSIADKDGNMVAITKTVNGGFGSGVMPEKTGLMLNNEMGDFDTGAGKANSVAPGKKPLSSMSPTIIMKDGEPFMVIGTPGGTMIITTLVQVISKVIDHNMDIQEAIDAPRIVDNYSNVIRYETRIPQDVVDKLISMGHKVESQDEWWQSTGSVQGVEYKENNTLRGGADPRRDNKALGY